ncbi:MAG: FAD:protein FMN transferase [Bdellovibrionota bacterium]
MKFKVHSLIVGVLFFIGCHSPASVQDPKVHRWPVMGTFYEVTWISHEPKHEELSKLMFEKVKWIDEKVSTYKSQSDLSKLNASSGQTYVLIDPTTKDLLEKSIQYRAQTKGWFNIAAGALVKLWKFDEPVHGEQRNIPSDSNIKKTVGVVQKTKIDWTDQMATLNPQGASLDMGAIAKGYAMDLAHSVVSKAACGFMNLGRQIMLIGNCSAPLRFGVQDPNDENQILATIELTEGSISTSGAYERFFIHNHRRYAHIINPKTGYPVESDVLSVTVWAQSATEADVWSTALFIAGLDEGIKMIEQEKKQIGVLWVLKDQRIQYRDSTFGRVIKNKL